MKFGKFALIAFALLLGGCTLDNPGMPVWENEFTVAIPGETYTMRELADDSLIFIQPGPDSSYDMLWINVSDSAKEEDKERVKAVDVSNDPTSKHYSHTIGSIDLGDMPPKSTPEFTISDLLGVSLHPNSPIPPSATEETYPIEDLATVNFDNFQEMTLESADLVITAVNDLFLEVSSIRVDLYDNSSGGKVFITSIDLPGPIPAHQSTSNADNPIKLTNISLSNSLTTDFFVTLPARDTTYIMDSEKLNSTISLNVEINAAKSSGAIAEVPSQSTIQHDSSEVGSGDDKISYGYVNKGIVNINFVNHLPISGKAVVVFQDIFKNGNKIRISKEIIANSPFPQTISYDLKGAEIQNMENPGAPLDFFKYTISIDTDSSDGLVEITSDDSITADILTDTLFFQEVEGEINKREIEISPFTKSNIADYGSLKPGFRFNQARLVLDFYNEIGVDVTANLAITGKHRDKDSGEFTDSVTIHLDNQVIHGSPDGQAYLTQLVLDNNLPAPNIVDLMEILPTDLSISGTAFIEGSGTIEVGQALWVDYELSTPLAIQITNPIEIAGEKTTIDSSDIGSDEQKFLRENVRYAKAQLTITNGFPVGVETRLYFSKDSIGLFSDTIADSSRKFTISDIFLPAAPTDEDGLVTTPLERVINVDLSAQNIQLIADVPLYTGFKVIINSTDGDAVFRADDKIKTKGLVVVRFLIDTQ